MRSEWIDLDHPPESIALVQVGIGVEPRMRHVPAQAAIRRCDTVSLLERRPRVRSRRAEEEAVEVLLAREIRAPRRESHGTVVQGPEHTTAGWIVDGLQPVVSGGRAGDAHRCLTSN